MKKEVLLIFVIISNVIAQTADPLKLNVNLKFKNQANQDDVNGNSTSTQQPSLKERVAHMSPDERKQFLAHLPAAEFKQYINESNGHEVIAYFATLTAQERQVQLQKINQHLTGFEQFLVIFIQNNHQQGSFAGSVIGTGLGLVGIRKVLGI